MRVVEIRVYPLKGAGGIGLERADVLTGGLRHDRRFMVLSEAGTFLTQREDPRLALITTRLRGSSLVIGVPGAEVEVALTHDGPRRSVRVWDDDTEAVEVRGDVATLLSSHLGQRCTLV